MKPRFELWDSDSANLLGSYESIPNVLADLDKAFLSAEEKTHITDLVLTLELGGDNDNAMILLNGAELYRLVMPRIASDFVVS